jgi:hypothetical protein
LPPVGEWLHEQLMGDDGGARGAYAANLHQHLPLAFDRGVLRAGDIPLALDARSWLSRRSRRGRPSFSRLAGQRMAYSGAAFVALGCV